MNLLELARLAVFPGRSAETSHQARGIAGIILQRSPDGDCGIWPRHGSRRGCQNVKGAGRTDD